MSPRLVLTFFALAAWLGCGDDEAVDASSDAAMCLPPEEVLVLCDPLPADSTEVGCQGPGFDGAPVPGGDGTTVWPVDCEVLYPECLDAYPQFVARCICVRATAPTWNCPI